MPVLRRLVNGGGERRSAYPRSMPSVTATGTAANVNVTPERSLQIGAVYSCVSLLSEAVAGLPVNQFERRNTVRLPVDDSPILRLVRDEPNPNIDAAELWRTVMGWELLRGTGYVFIERNGSGRPVGLWPLATPSVEPKRMMTGTRRGEFAYQATIDEENFAPLRNDDGIIQPEDMLVYRAFNLGSAEGLSPIGLARQSVGISFAAQQYMGGFYARDASPGSHIEVEGELTDEQYERLEKQWKSLHEGWQNSHRLAILEGGAKWATASLSPKDAEFIATQQFTRGEIASIYGVPPHMIGDTEKSTSWGTGIAEQGIGFVTYSLRRWTNRLERVTRRLFVPAERTTQRFRWDVDGLMQGDAKARSEAYAAGRQWGWLSVNDIKRKEDEQPVEGGDVYLQPLNMVPAGTTVSPAARSRRTSPARRAVPTIAADSAMVALYPPSDVAADLAVDGGLTADELHITLAYLGKGLNDEQLAEAEAIIESLALRWPELAGQFGGLGQFPEGEDGLPVFAPVDVAFLNEVRAELVEHLQAAGVPVAVDHGFTPHITLTYLGEGDDQPAPVPATPAGFPAISLVVGSERTDYPFTGGQQ